MIMHPYLGYFVLIFVVFARYILRESDIDHGKWYKYVCITTNQPDAKSNRNSTLTILLNSTQL